MEIKKATDGCFLKLMSMHGKTNVIQDAGLQRQGALEPLGRPVGTCRYNRYVLLQHAAPRVHRGAIRLHKPEQCSSDVGINVVVARAVNLSMDGVSEASPPSRRHLP